MSDQKIKVGITLGDVNGVGPEVVIKAFSDPRMLELCTPVIYGSAKVLVYYKRAIADSDQFQFTTVQSVREVRDDRINLINCMDEKLNVEIGVPTPEAGKEAIVALKSATEDLKNNQIDVLVTAPFNKENVQSSDFNYTGHTEFFGHELKGEPLMMMCSDVMKVGLATIHLPLTQVSKNVTQKQLVETLGRLSKSLTADFGVVKPKIAVFSLNPHAGDGGLLGDEEKSVIEPAIVEACEKEILAFGPFAADGFFSAGNYKRYDAILAMYHDQGLTPFKALSPSGVNYTAGLSKIRTSPDHGVAYDIAGKDVADESSMREAIYMAIDIYRNRAEYNEFSKNPLEFFERESSHKDLSVTDLLPDELEEN